jgi:hypothetical protein
MIATAMMQPMRAISSTNFIAWILIKVVARKSALTALAKHFIFDRWPIGAIWSGVPSPRESAESEPSDWDVLSEDTRCRSGLITRIRRASWFDQQNVYLPACHGPVLNPFRDHKHGAGPERNRAIPQLDVERSFEDKKKIVCLVMFVPMERPSSLATMMSLLL